MKFNFNILFVFILNFAYLECKIVKFKFEIYPINLANIDSIKSYNNYPKPELNYLANNDFIYRLLTDDFYFNLTFGTPPQTIPNIWNMEKYSFKVYNRAFNFSKSSSLKNISSSFRYNFD